MFVEVESRDKEGGEMTAVHCLSTPAIVWNEKEGGTKEGIIDCWCLKQHFVQHFEKCQ